MQSIWIMSAIIWKHCDQDELWNGIADDIVGIWVNKNGRCAPYAHNNPTNECKSCDRNFSKYLCMLNTFFSYSLCVSLAYASGMYIHVEPHREWKKNGIENYFQNVWLWIIIANAFSTHLFMVSPRTTLSAWSQINYVCTIIRGLSHFSLVSLSSNYFCVNSGAIDLITRF